jgi:RNA polymerase sigma-70 factor, ECF subfamily
LSPNPWLIRKKDEEDLMRSDSTNSTDLFERAKCGDQRALGLLFAEHRVRLERMIRLRLDRRLQSRLDPADVVQDAYLDVARRFPEYAANPAIPFLLWLRSLVGQRLVDLQRKHLGAQMRSVGKEVSLQQAVMPQVSSESLALQLLGTLTSPTLAVVRAETRLRLEEALNAMEPIDREVVVLRHFEDMSNGETAQVLGIRASAASKRYIRAIRQLKVILDELPGMFD